MCPSAWLLAVSFQQDIMVCRWWVLPLIFGLPIVAEIAPPQSKEFFDLLRQLPLLKPEVGKRVTKKIWSQLWNTWTDTPYNSGLSKCATTLLNIIANHMRCPLTLQKAYLNLKMNEVIGFIRESNELLDSIFDENCNKLNGAQHERCQFYLSNILVNRENEQPIDKIIYDCYKEERTNPNTSMSSSFKCEN